VVVLGILVGVALVAVLSSVKVVPEYRRLAILRLGQYLHLAGPGVVIVLPVFDRAIPVEVGQAGVLLEGGKGDFGGIFLPVEVSFSMSKAGTRIKIDRFEGSGTGLRVIVGRAA
jgi:hypothetical protein